MPDFAPLISLTGQKKKGFTPLTARTPQTMESGPGSGAGGDKSSEKSTGREEPGKVGGADAPDAAGRTGKSQVSDGGNQSGSVREVGIRDAAVCGKAPVVTMHRDTDDPSRIVGVRITCGCGEVTDVTFEYAEAVPPRSESAAETGRQDPLDPTAGGEAADNPAAASHPESGVPGVSGLENPGKEPDNPA
jgi:hypothetical protein